MEGHHFWPAITFNQTNNMYHKLIINNNHLCVRLPSGDWLVDTGSPLSFGEAPVEIGDNTHEVAKTLPGLSLAQLREFVGEGYVGLLGTDILNRYLCHFDIPNRRMGFRGELRERPSLKRIRLDMLPGGIPVVSAEMNDGFRQRLIFDTGAQYSYLNNIEREEAERIGRGTDFHPSLGRFPIEFFLKKLKLGTFEQDLQFSTQVMVSKMCRAYQTDGMLGLELLRTHEMFYNPKEREAWI